MVDCFTTSSTEWMPRTCHPGLSSASAPKPCTHGPQATQLSHPVPLLTLTVSSRDGHNTGHELRGPTNAVSWQRRHGGAARHEPDSRCAQPAATASQPAEAPATATFARSTAGSEHSLHYIILNVISQPVNPPLGLYCFV